MSDLPVKEGGKPVRESFLAFAAPVIEEEAIESVVETLRSGWIGTGPKVKKFEEEMASFLGVKNTLALNSCTAALHMALVGLGGYPYAYARADQNFNFVRPFGFKLENLKPDNHFLFTKQRMLHT